MAKGGLALDGRPTLTPQEPKRPSLLVSTHTYLYLPPSLPPLASTTLPLLRMLSNHGYHTVCFHDCILVMRVCVRLVLQDVITAVAWSSDGQLVAGYASGVTQLFTLTQPPAAAAAAGTTD